MVNQKAYCAKDELAKKASAARDDKKVRNAVPCEQMGYIEAGEQDNLIVQKLQEDTTPMVYSVSLI